ncbi:MAG: FHA domain-containing protein [Anaerolineales bacterium]
MKNIRIVAVALACLALFLPRQVAAQTGVTLTLRHLEAEAFPIIAGYLDARDAAGVPIRDLQLEELQMLEDGTPQPLTGLRTVRPGLRIIVVLNPAEAFAIRDVAARTRYDYVSEQMLAWAEGLPSGSSNLMTLITPEGVLVEGGNANQWLGALQAVPTDFGGAQMSNLALLQALQLASQPPAEPGMNTVIWWVTGSPNAEILVPLPEWQTQLTAAGIPLFVWQLDARSGFTSEPTLLLQGMVQASGGQWFGYSSGDPFPDPEDYFSPFRSVYFFQYTSQLHTGGAHQVQAQLEREGVAILSSPASFELDIRPPNPVLVSPPAEILRGPAENDPQQLSPFSQVIEILVEFPDDLIREVARTTLFVNGLPVAENSNAPFTRFAWDLRDYTASQQVALRVEAEDVYGLVGSSVEIPVMILVENPLTWYQSFLRQGGPALAISAVVLAAAAFFLVMVLSGRLRPPGRRSRRARRERSLISDPLSDSPLSGEQSQALLEAVTTQQIERAPAYLQRLAMQEAAIAARLLPLPGQELLIGSDAAGAIVLEDPSVEAQHARLTRLEDGSYHVADLRTQAGTWINYAPVSAEGSPLRHGDLLHIGRVAFRFLLDNRPGDNPNP